MDADICVIGGGAGGLTVAAGASQFGARTVLIEADRMGGECLNVGCVPSKALIAAARAAHDARQARRFGVYADNLRIDFSRVRAHVENTINAIAPMDSVERFAGLGVHVLKARARFIGPSEVKAGDIRIRSKRFVIATGSRPAIPPIPGLETVSFLTNESIFSLKELPEHLLVLGAGAVGVELAQAFRRLGALVSLIEAGRLLGREDGELTAVVRSRLREEGIVISEGQAVTRVSQDGTGIVLETASGRFTGSHLLVAAGRRPATDGLELEAANVALTTAGAIKVDAKLRTSNPRIYAIGDVTGGAFTHAAGAQGALVLKNALFRLPVRWNAQGVARVVFTDPELAQAGLTEDEARARTGRVQIARWSLAENDKARAEGDDAGHVKIIADGRGRILGAGIVGRDAGEMISLYGLALAKKAKLSDLAGLTIAYPLKSEIGKRAAGATFAPKLFSEPVRRIVRLLLRLP